MYSELDGSESSNCLHMIEKCWFLCLLFVVKLITIQVFVFAIAAFALLEREFSLDLFGTLVYYFVTISSQLHFPHLSYNKIHLDLCQKHS